MSFPHYGQHFENIHFPTPSRVRTPPPNESFYNEIYGSPKKPKSFKQWIEAAQNNTRDLLQFGSTSPLVWVLVQNKNFPLNAIVAGEERRQPLYIARTFYEGGICIGKAGHHLDRGAAFPYNGREIHVDTFEVLVPAFQPARYQISDSYKISHIPRLHRHPTRAISVVEHSRHNGVERLDKIKTVILVDDSSSMYDRLWPVARNALAGVVDLHSRYSTEGVDVHFLNNQEVGMNLKNGDAVQRLFDSVIPEGETPTGQKLQELFDKYIPLVENKHSNHRPITLVVITDGEPTDDPKDVIVEAARRLDQAGAPLGCFGVQFAQIGDDPDATDALKELDEDLSKVYGVRDIVDTTPFNPNDPNFTAETVTKILLGSIDKSSEDVASGITSPRDDLFRRF
ncbi:hypothetical protein AX17_000433 [Amanita inopinata Kibby_2008]|nr:hypothetical protein AX17_000433 [Amanita inopinata Kibby_2008]